MATRSRKLSRFPLLGAGLLAAMAVIPATSCSGGNSGPPASVNIGVPPLEQNALLYVAEAEGMFARNGVKVTVRDYDTGVATLDAMSKGEADIAETAEFPFINAVLAGARFRPLRSTTGW